MEWLDLKFYSLRWSVTGIAPWAQVLRMEVSEGLWITLAERDRWRHGGWRLAVDFWWPLMVDENQIDAGDSGVDGDDHGDAGDAYVIDYSNGRSW